MSGVKWRINTPPVSCTAATARTALQIVAPANIREKVDKIIVSAKGATAAVAAADVRILKQDSAGTMTALVPKKDMSTDPETLQLTAQHSATGTEPTAADEKENQYVPSYHGQRVFVGPFWIPGGQRLGVEITSVETIDWRVSAYGEE